MANLDPRLAPVVRELRAVLREREVPLKRIDEEKGWATGYMSQVVNGHRDMKLSHLFDALEVAGVEPRTFWVRLAGGSPDPDLERRLKLLEAAVLREGR